jgi:hypothetical protein
LFHGTHARYSSEIMRLMVEVEIGIGCTLAMSECVTSLQGRGKCRCTALVAIVGGLKRRSLSKAFTANWLETACQGPTIMDWEQIGSLGCAG